MVSVPQKQALNLDREQSVDGCGWCDAGTPCIDLREDTMINVNICIDVNGNPAGSPQIGSVDTLSGSGLDKPHYKYNTQS